VLLPRQAALPVSLLLQSSGCCPLLVHTGVSVVALLQAGGGDGAVRVLSVHSLGLLQPCCDASACWAGQAVWGPPPPGPQLLGQVTLVQEILAKSGLDYLGSRGRGYIHVNIFIANK
jgi:hypothetical protein